MAEEFATSPPVEVHLFQLSDLLENEALGMLEGEEWNQQVCDVVEKARQVGASEYQIARVFLASEPEWNRLSLFEAIYQDMEGDSMTQEEISALSQEFSLELGGTPPSFNKKAAPYAAAA